MHELLEARPVLGTEVRERFVGGRTDRDVVGVPEDAVRTERDDNGGILIVEDPRDRRDNVIKGGTSATPPSGRPSHSRRSGTRPSDRHASSSSRPRCTPR